MNSKKIKIVKAEESEITTEIIAEAIVSISEGIKKLKAGKLKDHALYLLIQHAAPMSGTKYKKTRVSVSDIKAVIQGMESLSKEYLK